MKNQRIENVEIVDWAVGDLPIAGTGFARSGLAAAIGNFDGVHLGHKKVIEAAGTAAKTAGLLPAIITFDPHPREFFRQDDAPFRLADRREKDRLLANVLAPMGPARVIHVRFDDALRSTPASDFVTDILLKLGVRQLFAGSDFAFGKGRKGGLDTINEVGKSIGISAREISLLLDENSAVFSSSRVRAALQAGALDAAAALLGHDWAVTGTVIRGDARGRTIGFPTANISLGLLQRPAFGAYAVEIDLDEGGSRLRPLGLGVANVGIRPTVENRGVLCEAHLFDHDIDLYDKRLCVRLKAFLRPERKFSAIEDLICQIDLDANAARQLLPKRA